MSGRVRVNGEERVCAAATIAELLDELGVDRGARSIAVARNGAVVARGEWTTAAVRTGDAIEIVRPFRGG